MRGGIAGLKVSGSSEYRDELTSHEEGYSDLGAETAAVDCRAGVCDDREAKQDHNESSGVASSDHDKEQIRRSDSSSSVP